MNSFGVYMPSVSRGVGKVASSGFRAERWKLKAVASAISVLCASQVFADNFQVTLEAPGVLNTTSQFTSVGVETFDALPLQSGGPLVTAFPSILTNTVNGVPTTYAPLTTFSASLSKANVQTAAAYGGANGTQFITTSTTGPITVTFNNAVNYFGLWISAMNAGNVISFYSGSSQTAMYSFDTQSMASIVTSAYNGNPSGPFIHGSPAEPFAFVNYYDTTGTFDRIVLSGAGFESDNWTVGSYSASSGQLASAPAAPPDIVTTNNGSPGFNTLSTVGGSSYTNRFDGGTLLVDSGTRATPATSSANFTIATGPKAFIDQNSNYAVFSGQFSDDTTGGRLIIVNGNGTTTGGKVTLANAGNTYSGGTEVRSGATLSIASAGALGTGGLDLVGSATVAATLEATATMTLSAPVTVAYDPVFYVLPTRTLTLSTPVADGVAAGDLGVDGGGTLLLTAANTYTGPTTVNAGSTLALAGAGSIATSSGLSNSGTLDLSAASTTVALTGSGATPVSNFAQTSTGNLLLSAAPSGFQKVTATGTAALNGTLTLNAANGAYSMGRYTLIDAAGGRSGTFSSFANNLATVTRLGFLLGYDANQVYLYLTPNADDTLSGIRQNTAALTSLFSNQSAALQAGLAYDCTVFDVNNVCVSVGGRNTYSSDGALANQGGLLVLGYRPTVKTRVGVSVDQALSNNNVGKLTQKSNDPTLGLFGNWARNEDGTGLNVHASAVYSTSDVTTARAASSTTEAGQGKTSLDGQAYELRANFVQPLSRELSVVPYLGLRYTHLATGAYTERALQQVVWPVHYNAALQETTSALAGVNASLRLAEKLTGTAGLGVQQTLNSSMGAQSGTSSIPGLTSFNVAMAGNADTQVTVNAGAYYDISKKERIAVNALWQEPTAAQQGSTSLMATVTLGF